MNDDLPDGFATIWIFARLRLWCVIIGDSIGFATIWIFARLRLLQDEESEN